MWDFLHRNKRLSFDKRVYTVLISPAEKALWISQYTQTVVSSFYGDLSALAPSCLQVSSLHVPALFKSSCAIFLWLKSFRLRIVLKWRTFTPSLKHLSPTSRCLKSDIVWQSMAMFIVITNNKGRHVLSPVKRRAVMAHFHYTVCLGHARYGSVRLGRVGP